MTTLSSFTRRARGGVAVAALAALALTGCATGDAPAADDHDDHDHDHDDHDQGSSEISETGGPQPRIAITYDGGIVVLDAGSLETVGDVELDGFNRLNPAGDGRHILVSTTGGWAALDAGTWTEPHGDHTHSYVTDPVLSDVLVPADAPGHVVSHDGLTALFDDGTGEVTILPVTGWADAVEAGSVAPESTYTTPEAHHGVAVALEDGSLFVTTGNEDERNGAQLLDAEGNVVAESDQCPNVHGEAALEDGTIVVGCEDGMLMLHGDHFHKVDSPDEFGRIGNAFPAAGSSVVLADYKSDPDQGLGLQQVALVDAESETMQLVDIGADYTWQGMARGVNGEALVLGADGALRVIDPTTAEVTSEIQVTDAWTVPEEWQTSHPAIQEDRGFLYVTDPATNQVHKVDYTSGEVVESAELPGAPGEIRIATASVPEGAEGE
ncbi:hypothetical protein GCM10011490_16210 [Pseudoclavibacter endophyticus]|uniref:PQQ-binding-like beta-propeller repeat protein n=1 Tax=Pseudoclavibacter endophyticus TaxID=1778590 RepID=A0A6H9WPV2_9MICO|nr:hypothetical protein [Pseudoclavibacter endophyticus]KAB1649007.1 hypothetical protein F8O04_01580 [Pseudoclavibacter endophyticus]GGA66290.1 hypothetical protein GCM10011490_16210 [Pseudoclavibacter endophyticus]